MKTYKLLVSGSSGLTNSLTEFVQTLGRSIAERTNLILVTGGLKQIKNRAFFTQSDYRQFVQAHPAFESIFESYGKVRKHKRYIDIDKIKDGGLDNQCVRDLESNAKNTFAVDYRIASAFRETLSRSDISKRMITYRPATNWERDVHFSYGKKIPVKHSNHRLRRQFMVHSCDAVITIEGIRATKEIIDFAAILKKPIIPLPFTGGASKAAWKEYLPEIMARHSHEEDDKSDAEILEQGFAKNNMNHLVDACIRMLGRRLRPKLFVAMKFSGHPLDDNRVYDTVRRIADKKGYETIRLDKEVFSGSIIEAIKDTIRTSDVVLADLTGCSGNVLYELGIAHTLDKKTILTVFNERAELPKCIPFDIEGEHILVYRSLRVLGNRLKKYI